MPATDKLLTDLHISYIQGLGKASGFFLCGSLIWHYLYRIKMTSCTISPLTWGSTLFIGGSQHFAFSVTPKHSIEMRWSISWWVVGTRRQVLYFPLNPPEPFCISISFLTVVLPSSQEHSVLTPTMMPIYSLHWARFKYWLRKTHWIESTKVEWSNVISFNILISSPPHLI